MGEHGAAVRRGRSPRGNKMLSQTSAADRASASEPGGDG
jgi:hypothetical protein